MKKILVCEDEEDIQKSLKNILKKNGYEAHTAQDGKEAIEMAKQINPDAILLDIRMPKVDGLDAAKQIRKFNLKTKIIFITGFQSPELSKEAAKYDIVNYIVKPASSETVLQAIEHALK